MIVGRALLIIALGVSVYGIAAAVSAGTAISPRPGCDRIAGM